MIVIIIFFHMYIKLKAEWAGDFITSFRYEPLKARLCETGTLWWSDGSTGDRTSFYNHGI